MNIGNWPTNIIPVHWEFYLKPNTRAFHSPVTRTRQVLQGQGEQWQALAQFKIGRDRAKAQQIEVLLDKLRGQVNTVNLPDFGDRGRPLGTNLDLSSIVGVTWFTDGNSPETITGFTDGNSPETITGFSGGSPGVTVLGGWSVGSSQVLVRGFPQNTTQLLAGDNVQIGRFLYRLTEDATADGLNRAYLTLNRPLVEDALHGDVVIREWARTPMQLVDDDQSRRVINVTEIREYTVSFQEAFF